MPNYKCPEDDKGVCYVPDREGAAVTVLMDSGPAKVTVEELASVFPLQLVDPSTWREAPRWINDAAEGDVTTRVRLSDLRSIVISCSCGHEWLQDKKDDAAAGSGELSSRKTPQ